MNARRCVLAIAGCALLVTSARGDSAVRQRIGAAGGWKNTRAVAAVNSWLYTVEGSTLYRTNPYTGEWLPLGNADFGNTQNMFALGPWLYTIETDGTLYRVGPGNGAWEQVGTSGGWADTITGCVCPFDAQAAGDFNLGRRAALPQGSTIPPDENDGLLYTVHTNGGIYATAPSSGMWFPLGKAEFADTRFMFFAQGWLYTIEADGTLYQVHPALGTWRQVGKTGDWKGTTAGTVMNGRIYTAEDDGRLYETVPSTGEYRLLASSGFEETAHMVAAGDAIYTIDLDGSLYRTEVPAPGGASPSANLPPATTADATPTPPAAAKPTMWYAVERTPVRRVRAVYQVEYSIADVEPVQWTLITTKAPELPSQTGVSTSMTPVPKVVREPSDDGRLLLISSLESSETRQPITMLYEATLWKRRLVRAPNYAVAPVSLEESERRRYLAATRTLDFESTPFQEWLDRNQLRRGEAEDAVDFGRRVYSTILGQYRTREEAGRIKGAPASVFCARETADCKVRATVFAAAMRAGNIPARVLGGILAQTPSDGSIPSHMRAEFFLADVGWVPVEFNYALDDPQNTQAHFGEDAGDLIVHDVGNDFAVPHKDGAVSIVYGLERPEVNVWGKGRGTISYRPVSWEVTTVPMPADEAAAIPPPAVGPLAAIDDALRPSHPSGPPSPTPTGARLNVTRVDFSIHPLENDLLRATIKFTNAAGDTKTFVQEATKDELRAWAKSLTEIPAEHLKDFLEGVDLAGNKRTPANTERPTPPAARPTTPAGRPTATTQRPPAHVASPTPAAPPPGGNRPMIPTNPSAGVSPGAGGTGSFNIKPISDGRYRLDATYQDAAGEMRSRTFEGTKDELRAALQAADLPEGARNTGLMMVDRIGQIRQAPARRAPLVSPRQGATP